MADTTGITVQQAFIRPGIPQDAARYLVSKQGLSSIEILRSLKSEMIKQICKRCAKSTGSPVADPVTPNPNYHPGYEISVHQEVPSTIHCFLCETRLVAPEDITMPSVARLKT